MMPRASRPTGGIAAAWWRALQPRADGSGGDRATLLARLRRAATASEAALEPAAIELCRRLAFTPARLGRVATAAAVLAHVREDMPGAPAARQLAEPIMSQLRFRRLIQADTEDAQLTAFRRAAALAAGRLNVADLGRSLLDWNEWQRRRWLYAYYEVPIPERPAGPDAKEDAE